MSNRRGGERGREGEGREEGGDSDQETCSRFLLNDDSCVHHAVLYTVEIF